MIGALGRRLIREPLYRALEQMTSTDDMMRQSWTQCRRGEPDAALRTAAALRQSALAAGDLEAAAVCSQHIAWFCLQCGDVDTGLEHARDARIFWAAAGDVAREAWSHAVLAWLMLECGLTEESANAAVEALEIAERCGDEATLALAINVLGVVFWTCRQLERAQALCAQAVEIARRCDDPVTLGWWLINLAGVHSEIAYLARSDGHQAGLRRAIDTAIAINGEAIALLEHGGDGWGLRIALCNAAEYHVSVDEIDAAEAHLGVWDAAPGRSTPRNDAQYFATKAQILIEQRRFEDAIAVCGMSLDMAVLSRNTEMESRVLRYMSTTYENLGQFENALIYYKRYHGAQLRMSAERTQRRARIAEILYETERFKRLADEAGRLADVASRRADELALSALIDPLTGIGNRRSLERTFGELSQSSGIYAVAVVDLDHFKGINDRFTHMVGDDVLRRVAATIVESLGPADSVIRLGGEEFVIVYRNLDLPRATVLCRELVERLAGLPWDHLRPGLAVTASIGVAASVEAGDPGAVLALADERVFVAKAAGRDCVVGTPPPPRKRRPAAARATLPYDVTPRRQSGILV